MFYLPERNIKQSHSSWGSSKEFQFIHLDLNPFFGRISFYHFEHLSISSMARAQLPGCAQERCWETSVSWLPGSSQNSFHSSRSLFDTSHLQPTVFRHRLSASDDQHEEQFRCVYILDFLLLAFYEFSTLSVEFGRIHCSHLPANDWFHLRCEFNIICKGFAFWMSLGVFDFTHNINLRILL